MTNLDSVLKSRDITLPANLHMVKALIFLEIMYQCESWIIKKAEHQRIDAFKLEKTVESPLDSKETKPVNPKGNQPRIFIGRTDAEVPILWSPDAKNQLIGKDPVAGKDWEQEETAEDEMVGWHHQLNGHEFEQTPGIVKDRKAWCAAVHGVTKRWTLLSY